MFGQNLAKLRKEKNLSQYKLAELMNFSRGQIANYEQGSREPDFETLERFADFFEVSIDYLLGRSNEPRSNIDQLQEVNSHLDAQDMSKQLELFQIKLKSDENLTFNGEPMSDEDKDSLLETMEFALRMLKKQKKKQLEDDSEEI